MKLQTVLIKLRTEAGYSQEKFAELMGVSRQAVQKWENGSSCPDTGHLIKMAKYFNISLDALALGSDRRMLQELRGDRKIQPEYSILHDWELYSSELKVEYQQSIEEGKEVGAYEDLFRAVSKMPKGEQKEKIAEVLFELVLNAPQRAGYPYNEPSDLKGIRSLRPAFEQSKCPEKPNRKDRIYGAWVGRICGCLLGKPVEGIRTGELIPLLEETGNAPMRRYLRAAEITEEMCEKYTFRLTGNCYADTIKCAPIDDDTNYTVLAQLLIEQYGRDFTPYDVSRVWLETQPKSAYCTAERVAYKNFVAGYTPPDSALYKNPYREWIGAQIRADYYGYINPGNPELAAEMAWRDASVSHVKNGIYGAMYVAAMLAGAAVCDDMRQIILCGLSQIPAASRLYEALSRVLADFDAGVSQKDCFSKLHREYDEYNSHDWCHTISNACIVTACLLYGGEDFGKSICMAVETGFDTDCNGATVGSVLGMKNGADSIGPEWTAPVNGLLDTSIFGIGTVEIVALAEQTLRHCEAVGGNLSVKRGT